MKGSRVLATGLLVVAVVALLAFAGIAGAKKPRPADTVFTHGYVYTVNPGQRTAQAVAVRGDKMMYVGSNRGVRAFIGKKTEVVDLKGKMLMPSFSAWVLPPVGRGQLPLRREPVRRERHAGVQGQLSVRSSPRTPISSAYQGSGWSEALYPGIGPLASELVGLTTKPMALWSDGHHSLWVNQAALTLAGIDNTTADPIGGVIERVPGSVATDPPYGTPSGTLRESATDIMMAVFLDFTVEQYKEGILLDQTKIANPVGINRAGRRGVPRVQLREGLRGARAGRRDDSAHPRVVLGVTPDQSRGAAGHRCRRREGEAQDHVLQDQRREVLRRRRHRGPHRPSAPALRRRARLQG